MFYLNLYLGPAEMIDDVSSAVDKLNGFLQPLRERINDIKESFQDGSWYSKLKDWLEGVVEKKKKKMSIS